MNKAKKKKSIRIALTGGPGAGKTHALELLKSAFGTKIVIVPEAATFLYTNGFPRGIHRNAIESAQEAIYYVQKNLEEVIATENPDKIILCDRGTLDGAAYWPTGKKAFFKRMHTTLKAELKRYDGVLFLESALGKFKLIQPNNHCRTETPIEAIQLDHRLRLLWKAHPNFRWIHSAERLEDKMDAAFRQFQELVQALGYKLFSKK